MKKNFLQLIYYVHLVGESVLIEKEDWDAVADIFVYAENEVESLAEAAHRDNDPEIKKEYEEAFAKLEKARKILEK